MYLIRETTTEVDIFHELKESLITFILMKNNNVTTNGTHVEWDEYDWKKNVASLDLNKKNILITMPYFYSILYIKISIQI